MKMKLSLILTIILFSCLVSATLTDPVNETFGGIGNRVEITDIISLNPDKSQGYIDEFAT